MLIGHDQIRKDINRLIERDLLASAYLFFGPAQIGKYTFARALARFLESGSWPQGSEDEIRPLSDVLFVEPDGAGTIGVDAARGIKVFLAERPNVSRYRTVVIDRADALTTEAQNALLKIAEEPPQGTLLILAVTDPDMLMPTLQSRLQKVYFARVAEKEIADWLAVEGITIKEAKAAAKAADGKPGLALALAKGTLPETETAAREFLRVASGARRDHLKELLAPEEFNFRSFLDGLIAVLARDDKRSGRLWHAVLELRSMADATGLNPSMQLRYLWTLI